MSARVICISRTMSAGAEDVAAEIAKQLQFRCVNEEIIAHAAERHKLDPADVADVEKRKSFFARLFDDIGGARGGETATYVPEPGLLPVAKDDLRAMIRHAIVETAALGSVVIVAHAASYALGKRSDVLRVLLTGSPAVRAGRLASGGVKSPADASREIRESDVARADYLKRFYQVERELPEHYDLVISTDMLTPLQAAGIVVVAAGAVGG